MRRDSGDPFANLGTGAGNFYVITAEPAAVYQRCLAACVEIAKEPSTPEHDPSGTVFTARDSEGNLWSFGTYAGDR